MQVQRQFIEVKSRQLVIELPESFVNHQVEVITLTAVSYTHLTLPTKRIV